MAETTRHLLLLVLLLAIAPLCGCGSESRDVSPRATPQGAAPAAAAEDATVSPASAPDATAETDQAMARSKVDPRIVVTFAVESENVVTVEIGGKTLLRQVVGEPLADPTPLKDELKRRRAAIMDARAGPVNFVMKADPGVPYEVISRVMILASEPEFKSILCPVPR